MRRGFTMIEVLIASALATTLIVLVYSSLVWYSKSAQREDENLEKSRRAQEVLGLIRDDFGRAAGEIKLEDVPLEALKELGWDGNAADFLTTPRPGRHQVNAWSGWGSTSPYLSKSFEFSEKWDQGKEIAYSRQASSFERDSPPASLSKIEPRAATRAVVHVVLPSDKPQSEWILIRREAAGTPTFVLWALHRVAKAKWNAGALVRWTAATGAAHVGGKAVQDFQFRVASDWMAVDAAPPNRPDPDVRLLSTLARVELRYPPAFEASAILLLGP